MKYEEMFRTYEGLTKMKSLKGLTFNLAVVKNKNRMLEEIKQVEETYKVTDEYREFEEKRIETCEKHCKRKEDGSPEITENGEYSFEDAEFTKFEKALKTLQKKYKEAIDFRQNQLKELSELEEKGVDLSYVTIKEKDLPRDISTEDLETVYFMIK